jgi:hypothetical protein
VVTDTTFAFKFCTGFYRLEKSGTGNHCKKVISTCLIVRSLKALALYKVWCLVWIPIILYFKSVPIGVPQLAEFQVPNPISPNVNSDPPNSQNPNSPIKGDWLANLYLWTLILSDSNSYQIIYPCRAFLAYEYDL